jgi:hypothetical protein
MRTIRKKRRTFEHSDGTTIKVDRIAHTSRCHVPACDASHQHQVHTSQSTIVNFDITSTLVSGPQSPLFDHHRRSLGSFDRATRSLFSCSPTSLRLGYTHLALVLELEVRRMAVDCNQHRPRLPRLFQHLHGAQWLANLMTPVTITS